MTDDLHVGDARLLRERLAELEGRISRRPSAPAPGTGRRVGRVYSPGAMPTGPGKFYACHPVVVTGSEIEGGTPVLSEDTSRTFLVTLLGGTAAAGDYLVCRRVDHRWVSCKGGASTPVNPYSVCVRAAVCNGTWLLDGATCELSNSAVGGFTITNAGTGYTSPPTMTFSGGGGSGAAGRVNIVGAGSGLAGTGNALLLGGHGYTSPPTITFSGGGGSGAAATAFLSNTWLASVDVTSGGSGYTSPPTVTFSGGGASAAGAAATATIVGGSVTGVTLTSKGRGYATPPTITFGGGGGTGASATATLDRSFFAPGTLEAQVLSIAVNNPGSGYTAAGPTVTIAPGGGSGATATANLTGGQVSSFTVTNGGSGYDSTGASPPLVELSGGGGTVRGTGGTANVNASGAVQSITRQCNQGSYGTTPPTVTITSGHGSGATAVPVMGTTVAGFTVTSQGTGYSSFPTVTVSGGGGNGASGGAVLDGSPITAVSLVSGGGGYTDGTGYSATFSGGGGGTGAAASFDVAGGVVTSITLTAAGTGYLSAPTIGFSAAGGGVNASASATTAGGKVTSINLLLAGGGYTSTPSVSITGGGGSGAAATSTLGTSYSVKSITVTGGGTGYKKTPKVTLAGGGGSGAVATATVAAQDCIPAPQPQGSYSVDIFAPAGDPNWSSGTGGGSSDGTTLSIVIAGAVVRAIGT